MFIPDGFSGKGNLKSCLMITGWFISMKRTMRRIPSILNIIRYTFREPMQEGLISLLPKNLFTSLKVVNAMSWIFVMVKQYRYSLPLKRRRRNLAILEFMGTY